MRKSGGFSAFSLRGGATLDDVFSSFWHSFDTPIILRLRTPSLYGMWPDTLSAICLGSVFAERRWTRGCIWGFPPLEFMSFGTSSAFSCFGPLRRVGKVVSCNSDCWPRQMWRGLVVLARELPPGGGLLAEYIPVKPSSIYHVSWTFSLGIFSCMKQRAAHVEAREVRASPVLAANGISSTSVTPIVWRKQDGFEFIYFGFHPKRAPTSAQRSVVDGGYRGGCCCKTPAGHPCQHP